MLWCLFAAQRARRNVHLLLPAWLQVADPGFRTNDARGVGMVFGPDVTEVRAA